MMLVTNLVDDMLTDEINEISYKLDHDSFLPEHRRAELLAQLREIIRKRRRYRKTIGKEKGQDIQNKKTR